MRCFIAIELSPELKGQLALLTAGIDAVRPVPPEQLHLTLAFLGEQDETTISALSERLAACSAATFSLHPSRCGCFPDRRHPRVLWIGFRPEALLDSLARTVGQAATDCGIVLEERNFTPHITLARVRQPARPDITSFLASPCAEIAPFEVCSYQLFQSRLTAHGAIHTRLRSFDLITSA